MVETLVNCIIVGVFLGLIFGVPIFIATLKGTGK